MSYSEDLLAALKANNQTVSFAESCTGGLLSSELTRLSGVSAYFLGSVVSYSNEAKENLLGVPKPLMVEHGAVSVEVAMEMAKGARKCLKSDWSVAITGVAGPSGGSELKPVGTVCFAWVGPGLERSEKTRFDGGRWNIQNASAQFAAETLIALLKEN